MLVELLTVLGNLTAEILPLFESGDAENRVSDPMLELRQWFFSDSKTGAATVHVNRVAFGQSPAGQAAIFLPGSAQNPKRRHVRRVVQAAVGHVHRGALGD